MNQNLKKMATALRALSADMIEKAKSGHPGAALGMADLVTVLYTRFLKFNPKHPDWFNRDRIIYSNGHASALIYSALHFAGYQDLTMDELKRFRQQDSLTPGHPETHVPGVDFGAGPLGQGIASAVGMALAERMMNARFGDELVNHKTYCFVGDGCLMEGVSEEAISLAGLLNLKNLIVLWDDNTVTIDGHTDIATKTDMKKRFEANGWQTIECDGHNYQSIEDALTKAQTAQKPTLIDCHTIIGYKAGDLENTSKVHGSPLGDCMAQFKSNIGWEYAPFDIPAEIYDMWKDTQNKSESEYNAWEQKANQNQAFLNQINGILPDDTSALFSEIKKQFASEKPNWATRKAGQFVLQKMLEKIPFFVGGSADLGASNLTKTAASKPVSADNYAGNYINYGVREHGMGAISNGIAAHGGYLPYSSTFFVFSDYMRPAIRMAALMNLKEFFIFTHDSIGSGEDGPTHQPVEHLVSLRAMPNITVFRPADSIETVECYQTALDTDGPSCLVLSRQNLPTIRFDSKDNLTSKGAYVLRNTETDRQLTFIASGSEVSLALQAADTLAQKGIAVAVVSVPCLELFQRQTQQKQDEIFGLAPRFFIEAGSAFSWYPFKREQDFILSMDCFGQSAPAEDNFKKYGFTTENVVSLAQKVIQK